MIFEPVTIPDLREVPVIVEWRGVEFDWARGVDIGEWLDLWWGKHWDN